MKYKLILASGSPRRKEILSAQGIEFLICKALKEELTDETIPSRIVQDLSESKAKEVYEKQEINGNFIVLAADTMVVKDDKIMGKPKDSEDAISMLMELQGAVHQVYTGVTMLVKKEEQMTKIQFVECTDVTMYPMSEEDIKNYVKTGEPMDKAGAYAIQGKCGVHIKEIKGDYNNVVGLPIARIYQECKRYDISVRSNSKE